MLDLASLWIELHSQSSVDICECAPVKRWRVEAIVKISLSIKQERIREDLEELAKHTRKRPARTQGQDCAGQIERVCSAVALLSAESSEIHVARKTVIGCRGVVLFDGQAWPALDPGEPDRVATGLEVGQRVESGALELEFAESLCELVLEDEGARVALSASLALGCCLSEVGVQEHVDILDLLEGLHFRVCSLHDLKVAVVEAIHKDQGHEADEVAFALPAVEHKIFDFKQVLGRCAG